jgi:hypothetical protein
MGMKPAGGLRSGPPRDKNVRVCAGLRASHPCRTSAVHHAGDKREKIISLIFAALQAFPQFRACWCLPRFDRETFAARNTPAHAVIGETEREWIRSDRRPGEGMPLPVVVDKQREPA